MAEFTDGDPPAATRRVRPLRGLPGGRAVVGALLVAAAALLTFVAYLDATAAPTVRYVVATASVQPGTRLADLDGVGERFGTIALDVPAEVAAGLVPATEVEQLVGRVVVAPLRSGDLLTRSHVLGAEDVPAAQTLSFSLPRWSAVGGALQPGERIDVLATQGSGVEAYTAFVARGIPVLAVSAAGGGPLDGAGEVTLTVAVTALEDVQALAHAVATAELLVTRSVADAADDPAPGAYRAEPTLEGPRPDPAGSPAGGAGSDPDGPAGQGQAG